VGFRLNEETREKTVKKHTTSLLTVVALGIGIGCSGDRGTTTNTQNTNNNSSGGSGDAGAAQATTNTPGPDAATTPPPPAMAKVRMIHASPAPEAASVAVYLDDNATPALNNFAYKAVAGYVEVPVGAHQAAVRPAAAAATTPPVVSVQTPALEADKFYTVIAHGLATGTPALALTPLVDEPQTPPPGQAHVRFFHALAGVAAVDICTPGANARAAGTPVFTNVAYGAASSYAPVPMGSNVRLQVRAQNARACSGAVAGVVTIPQVPDHGVITAVAVGNAGRPAVTKELLLCSDPPLTGASECTTIPIAAR